MPTLLAPLGLVVVTTSQRNALTATDGQLVWNADQDVPQVWRNQRWETVTLDDDLAHLIGALVIGLGQVRSALRFMGVEPGVFPPDIT